MPCFHPSTYTYPAENNIRTYLPVADYPCRGRDEETDAIDPVALTIPVMAPRPIAADPEYMQRYFAICATFLKTLDLGTLVQNVMGLQLQFICKGSVYRDFITSRATANGTHPSNVIDDDFSYIVQSVLAYFFTDGGMDAVQALLTRETALADRLVAVAEEVSDSWWPDPLDLYDVLGLRKMIVNGGFILVDTDDIVVKYATAKIALPH